MTVEGNATFETDVDRNGKDVDNDDVSSVATPVAGFNKDSEDNVHISKTIRFYFAATHQYCIDRTQPSEVHSEWIRLIQSAFGTDVKIINNSNRKVTRIDNTSSSHRASYSHAQQFQIHSKPIGKNSSGALKHITVIVHRIKTKVPFSQIKRHPSALQWLKKHQCYINEHLRDDQTWDVQQIGFVTGFNPKFYTSERARDVFRARICRAAPRAKAPKFQFVLNSQRIQFNDRTSSTQAFSVEVPSHQSPQLVEALKAVTTTSRAFASSKMRRKSPEAYQGAIRYQNHLLANQHVVVINHLGTDAMYYLADRIKAIAGVIDVVPNRNVSINRQYYVLAPKEQINAVRATLYKRFEKWYIDDVPIDARPREGRFYGPPMIAKPRTDDYSSGEQSYLTTSSRNFMEYSTAAMTDSDDTQDLDGIWDSASSQFAENQTQQTEQTDQHPPKQIFGSYASAVTSEPISVVTDSEQAKDRQNEELTSRMSQLEAMITRLCHQVQTLTDAQQQSYRSDRSELPRHERKRQDTKSTPRKEKPTGPREDNTISVAEEDSKEKAPTNDNHRTVWDDSSTESLNV